MKFNNFPIGLFDSGIGGTSIWKEITTLLPNEDTIYLSDSKNAPYGEKSKQNIIELSIKNTEFLIKNNCKLIVVACNTATTNAIQILRKNYNIPFIGIEPAIKPAALKTKSNRIGILATKGTLNSHLFEKTSSKLDKKIIIKETIGENLVDLIEDGKIDSKEMQKLLKTYLKPMLDDGIDCLVLGCTHYPFLIPNIRKIIGNKIEIIDSGKAVAKQTKAVLEKNNLLSLNTKKAKHQFYVNKSKAILKTTIISSKKSVIIEEKDF
jgi:glutamate racemase